MSPSQMSGAVEMRLSVRTRSTISPADRCGAVSERLAAKQRCQCAVVLCVRLCWACGCAVRVASRRRVASCSAVFDGVRGQASTVASEAGVRQAEVRGDGAVAGHVVGVETNFLCDAEGDAVVDARTDEELTLADQLAQHRQHTQQSESGPSRPRELFRVW